MGRFGLPISDKPPDAHKRDADPDYPVFLKGRASAPGNFLDFAVVEQRINGRLLFESTFQVYLLHCARHDATQEVEGHRCPNIAARYVWHHFISGARFRILGARYAAIHEGGEGVCS